MNIKRIYPYILINPAALFDSSASDFYGNSSIFNWLLFILLSEPTEKLLPLRVTQSAQKYLAIVNENKFR